MINRILFFTLVAIGCAGCQEKAPAFVPIHGHYGVSPQWVALGGRPSPSLSYKDDSGKVTFLWPFLGDLADPVVHDEIAFLAAPYPDEEGALANYAYFATDGSGPVVDVSNDLLKLWTEQNHLDFDKLKGHYEALRMEEVDGGIRLEYLSEDDKPQANFVASWDQIKAAMHDVKQHGKLQTVTTPPTTYLRNTYGLASDAALFDPQLAIPPQ